MLPRDLNTTYIEHSKDASYFLSFQENVKISKASKTFRDRFIFQITDDRNHQNYFQNTGAEHKLI